MITDKKVMEVWQIVIIALFSAYTAITFFFMGAKMANKNDK